MHCDASLSLPLDPLPLPALGWWLPAAHWGVAPDPHQGRCPWTPLRVMALRTHLLHGAAAAASGWRSLAAPRRLQLSPVLSSEG